MAMASRAAGYCAACSGSDAASWTWSVCRARTVRPVSVTRSGWRGQTLRSASSCARLLPRAATQWISSPSKRNTAAEAQRHSRKALSAMAWATVSSSDGEPEMTLRICAVAACCSRDSVSAASFSASARFSAATRRRSATADPAGFGSGFAVLPLARDREPGRGVGLSSRDLLMSSGAGSPASSGSWKRAGNLDGKADRERAAAAKLAPDLHVASHHATQAPRQGEAEAGASVLPAGMGADLREVLEQPGHVLRAHADPGIGHLEPHPWGLEARQPLAPSPQRDRTLLGELARVGQEVEQALPYLGEVRPHLADVRGAGRDEGVTPAIRERPDHAAD